MPSSPVPDTRERERKVVKPLPEGLRKRTLTPPTPETSSVTRAVTGIVALPPEVSITVGVKSKSASTGGVTSSRPICSKELGQPAAATWEAVTSRRLLTKSDQQRGAEGER